MKTYMKKIGKEVKFIPLISNHLTDQSVLYINIKNKRKFDTIITSIMRLILKKHLNTALVCLFLLFVNESRAGVWTRLADHGGVARHRASGFAIGGRGYVGLGHVNTGGNRAYEDFWEYDPASDTWTQKANFGGGERYHATSFVIGNTGYVGMGHDHNDDYTPTCGSLIR